jgi:hypothetical protein
VRAGSVKKSLRLFQGSINGSCDHKGKKAFIYTAGNRQGNKHNRFQSYDSDIQKCVVLMKDELEKAKEQILNVL